MERIKRERTARDLKLNKGLSKYQIKRLAARGIQVQTTGPECPI